MNTYLLTYNPDRWQIAEGQWLDDMAIAAAGGRVPDRWSTNSKRLRVGDRAYLLRQGPEPRGIIASGWVASEPYEDQPFDERPGLAWYVDVEWDAMVALEEPLLTADLLVEVPGVQWKHLLSSGVSVDAGSAVDLDSLWRQHLGHAGPAGGGARSRTRGRLLDPAVRKAVEDHAQRLLMERYRGEGWTVEDTRVGNPYDAVATRAPTRCTSRRKGPRGQVRLSW